MRVHAGGMELGLDAAGPAPRAGAMSGPLPRVLTRSAAPPRRRPPAAARRRGAAPRLAVRIAALAIVLAGLAAGAAGYDAAAALLADAPDARSRLDRLVAAAGFGLDQIEVSGQRRVADGDVLDTLDLPNVRSFLTLDSAAVRARIERLAWVRTATLTRVFPGTLQITIAERTPFAVWRHAGRSTLIDETGRELGAADAAAGAGLPKVAGEGAAREARALLERLAQRKRLAALVAEAERIGERRWRLRLAAGGVVELPAAGEERALAALVEAPWAAALLGQGDIVIDLRSPARAVIGRRGAAHQPVQGG